MDVLVSHVRTTALVLVRDVKMRLSPTYPHKSTRHIRSTSLRAMRHLTSTPSSAPTAHIVTALSFPDEARNWPSDGLNARRSTPPTCATHSCARSWLPERASQRIIVLSADPLAIHFPSGEKASTETAAS